RVAHRTEAGCGSGVRVDARVPLARRLVIDGVDERATAGADHLPTFGRDLRNGFTLDGTKCNFAVLAKNLRNGAARHALDVPIAVDEVHAQAPRHVPTEGRLAAAAEANQDQTIHASPGTFGSCSTL